MWTILVPEAMFTSKGPFFIFFLQQEQSAGKVPESPPFISHESDYKIEIL